MGVISVHVLFEHGADHKPFGVAYIRDILPLSYPTNSQIFKVTSGTTYQQADVIIIERMWKPGATLSQVQELVDQVRSDRGCLVYSIDDNLLDLDHIPVEARMAARFLCREAHGVLVSTNFLRSRLNHLNPKIYVLPNALDERLFEVHGRRAAIHSTDPEHKTIGYMGTFTHDADLMMVFQALRRILRKYQNNLQFHIVGGVSDPSIYKMFKELPIKLLRVPVKDVSYPNFIKWMANNTCWDLGIAPLENTFFNRSKSDIKFLDYSAFGIPGIYSHVPSYEKSVQHLKTGYLAWNTPADWSEGFELLLSNDQLRLELAKSAQDYVFSKRTLKQCAVNWRDAILDILNSS